MITSLKTFLRIVSKILLYSILCTHSLHGYDEKPVQMRTTAPNAKTHNSVFIIERKNQHGQYSPHGTGFFIHKDGVVYGVTARHVVQSTGMTAGEWTDLIKPIYIRLKPDTTAQFAISDDQHLDMGTFIPYDQLYFFSQNSLVDTVVFPLLLKRDAPFGFFATSIDKLQKDEEVKVGEDIYVIGFPGPFGFDSGNPIIRSGSICYKVDRNNYLLDANAWPGDSGGLIASKPYFGVPVGENSSWQWQYGGKILGVVQGGYYASQFGLSPELEGFKKIVSAQSVLDILESPRFVIFHSSIKKIFESRDK